MRDAARSARCARSPARHGRPRRRHQRQRLDGRDDRRARARRAASASRRTRRRTCRRCASGSRSTASRSAERAIVDAADAVAAAGGDELTFFEQLTAIACVVDRRAPTSTSPCSRSASAAGSTRPTSSPRRVAVVTGVALDHEAILGDTLEAIAFEKAGIFKPGQRVVIGASGEPAAVPCSSTPRSGRGGEDDRLDDSAIARVPPVALPGAHQRANAAAALAVHRRRSAHRARDVAEVLAHVHPSGPLRSDRRRRSSTVRTTRTARGARRRRCASVEFGRCSSRRSAPTKTSARSPKRSCRRSTASIATRYQQERAMDPAALLNIFGDVPRPQAPPPEQQALFGSSPPIPAPFALETAPDLASALAVARALAHRSWSPARCFSSVRRVCCCWAHRPTRLRCRIRANLRK